MKTEKNICKYCKELYVFPLGDNMTCKRCESNIAFLKQKLMEKK